MFDRVLVDRHTIGEVRSQPFETIERIAVDIAIRNKSPFDSGEVLAT